MSDNNYTKVQEYNNQGLVLYSQNKYADALTYFKKALDADPYYIDTYINVAQVYIMQDIYGEAKKYLEKALLIDKKAAPVYFHLGNVALLENDAESAREHYNKAISLGYDNVQIYINLAADAEEHADFDEALSYYNRAIAIDKFNALAKARKAQILISLKRLQEALVACDSLIETNPDIFEGYHYKFSILAELGRTDEAEAVLDRGIELFPDDDAFFYDKARLLQAKGESEEALKLVQEKVSVDEDNRAAITAFQCELLLALGRTDEAEPILNAEFSRSHDGEIAFLLTSVSIAKKDYEKALECSDYILKNASVDNYYYSALYYKAIALKKLGRQEAKEAFENALKFLRAACARTPGQLQLYFYRAMCHQELEQYQEALELTDYIINVDDSIAEVHYARSRALEALGNHSEAQQEMVKANEINPDLAKVLEG